MLPANTFTDALGLKMTFAAYEVSGQNVTSWLHFNTITDAFSGTAPANASGTFGLEVIATDAQHVTAADSVQRDLCLASAHARPHVRLLCLGPDPVTPQ